METDGINGMIRYANEHLCYLREGDYLPGPLSDMNDGRGVGSVERLTEMLELGAVYPNKAVAMMVSERVRRLLGRTAIELLASGKGQTAQYKACRENAGIVELADNNLWYLRECDYQPMPLSSMNGGRGVGSREFLAEMRRIGTLYPTEEAAKTASERVRVLLSQASSVLCASSQRLY